jgi:hypothetical protein
VSTCPGCHVEERRAHDSYCLRCRTAYNRLWHQEHRSHRREIRRRRLYGMSAQEYTERLIDQEYKCAICRRGFSDEVVGQVDHEAKSGRIRGILCGRCNKAIGLLQDDPFIIGEAKGYLENFAEEVAERP